MRSKAPVVSGMITGGVITGIVMLYYYFAISGGPKAEYDPFYERIYGIVIPAIAGTIMGGVAGWLSKRLARSE